MTEEISKNVFKLNVDSNIYLIKDKKIVIDTGPRSYHNIVKGELSKIIDLDDIKKVIFTHLHMDHIGNFDLFQKAEFFASKEEIEDFEKMPVRATLDPIISLKLKKIELKPLKSFDDFKVIETPGHTKGSVCILYKKILFSGDTLFFNDNIGRLDLPTSQADKMQDSLEKLKKLDYKILAPGHDY